MQKTPGKIIATALFALLALTPVQAQGSDHAQPTSPTDQPELTLQLKQDIQTERRSKREKLKRELPKVKELRERPHGRSRIDPEPQPAPPFEIKWL